MPRKLPLFDPAAHPSSWNERMVSQEFAVHLSAFYTERELAPYCVVWPTLLEAETFAHEQVALHPELRCTIYTAEGLVGAPVRDIRGVEYREKGGEISMKFRRWVGGFLFFGGAVLTGIDWVADFKFVWPSLVGTRMLIPGAVLLATEGLILLNARQKSRAAEHDVGIGA